MIGPATNQTAQDRARAERLDVLAGIRGNENGKALTVADLNGVVAELVLTIVTQELKKRGL